MGRSAGTEGALRSLRGECSNQFAAARMERDLHKCSVPPLCTPQPETRICQCWWGLGAEPQASEIRPGERTGVGCMETPRRGWSLVQLHPRMYTKEAWAALEARRHCVGGAQGEGWGPPLQLFFLRELSGGKTQPA